MSCAFLNVKRCFFVRYDEVMKKRTQLFYSWWEYLLLIGLGISPFVYWLPAQISFEIPRVWWVLCWIEVLLVVGLFLYGQKQKINQPLLLVWVGLIFLMSLSSIVGQDFLHSFFGNYYRMDGLLTYAHLWLLAVLVGWYATHSVWKRVLITLAVTNCILSLFAIAHFVWFKNIWGLALWDGAVGLTFGNPNFLAGYLVVTYPAIVYFANMLHKQYTFFTVHFLSLLPLVAVGLTASRAALLCLGFFWVTLWAKSMHTKSAQMMQRFLIIGLVVTAGVWFKMDTHDPTILFAAESRERIVRKMLDGWKDSPWLGYGWANAQKAFEGGVWPYVVRFDVHVDKAHSTLLEYLTTTGIIGLVGYLLLLRIVILRLKQKSNTITGNIFWGMFLMYILYAQTNVLSISTEVIFTLMVGFSLQET